MLTLPEIFKCYWKDFGANQQDVVRFILKMAPSSLVLDIRKLVGVDASTPITTQPLNKVKLNFVPFDWQTIIVL